MGLDGYSAERGQTPNRLHESLLELRADNLRAARSRICDMVFVYDYDSVNQTVDVVLVNNRGSQPIRGIPIAGTGGHGIRNIRAWKGLKQTTKPDIGILVYPRVGGGRKILDFIRRDTNATYARIEETAIFFGGIPAAISAGETPVDNVVATETSLLHQIGKNDNGMVATNGAGFMVKENGDVVVRGTRIFFLGLDQVEADAKLIGRNGDGAASTISASTTKVYSG